MTFSGQKTERASSKERKEADTGDMSWDTNTGHLRGNDLAMAEGQAVMGTTHGIPSETTPASGPGTFPYTSWTLEHEMQCTHYTILWKHVLVWKDGEAMRRCMHTCVRMHSHTHTHSHHVFIVPKAKTGGGEGPFGPRTKKVFSNMSCTQECNHKFQWAFPLSFPVCSVLQTFVLRW